MLSRWLRHSDNQDQNTDYEGESDTATNFNTSDIEESPKSHNTHNSHQRSNAAQLSLNPCKLAWGTATNFTTSETEAESGKSPSSQNSHNQRRREAAAHLSLHPCKLAWGGGQRSNYLTTTTLV